MGFLDKLHSIRERVGPRVTEGLPDEVLTRFSSDKNLSSAIEQASAEFSELQKQYPELLKMGEADLIQHLQADYINFYPAAQTNPYVSLAAQGPWIISTHGAVIHDSGGYGMLGLGQSPETVVTAMSKKHVMANVMTANFSQLRLAELLKKEVGHTRSDEPFAKFICMNSGSEAATVAARITDVHAKTMTDPGGPHAGKSIRLLSHKGGFHGRTDRPAKASPSTFKNYEVLATFRDHQYTWMVEPNNLEELQSVFQKAEQEGVYIEAFFMEPVMGEGNPGLAVTREYYDLARELTKKHNTLLMVDSVQAGLRAQGCLSICDYPGFQDCEAPDMEAYSKALNAGQYPLSVLALTSSAAELYIKGIYGNTMTTNPRALDVASAVLSSVTPELRQNIRDRGVEFVEKLSQVAKEFPEDVVSVQGTGLLCCMELNPKTHKVVGFGQVEEYLRKHGIGIIHGGHNALRLTPHFAITSQEVDLVVDAIRDVLQNGPRLS